jgi:predicted ribosomally synthesized six-cysteine peptide SCIFF
MEYKKRIITLETRDLAESAKTGGCGECQTSCRRLQDFCGIANQQCEQKKRIPAPSTLAACRKRQGGIFLTRKFP